MALVALDPIRGALVSLETRFSRNKLHFGFN